MFYNSKGYNNVVNKTRHFTYMSILPLICVHAGIKITDLLFLLSLFRYDCQHSKFKVMFYVVRQ